MGRPRGRKRGWPRDHPGAGASSTNDIGEVARPILPNAGRLRSGGSDYPIGGRPAQRAGHRISPPADLGDERRHAHPLGHRAGRPEAAEQLLPLVYDELRKLAAQRLAQEKPGQTLQATALVHDAYLRLVDARSRSAGTAAATSSPPPPRPCAASWSRPPGASGRPKHGGDRRRVDLRRGRRGDRPARRRPPRPGRGPDEARRRGPGLGRAGQAPLLRRPVHRRGRRGPRPLAAHRRPPLGLRPGLAPSARCSAAERPGLRRIIPVPWRAPARNSHWMMAGIARRIFGGGVGHARAVDLHGGPGLERPSASRRPTSAAPAAATTACGPGRGPPPPHEAAERVRARLGSPAVDLAGDGRHRPAPVEGPARSSAPTSCWSRSARGAWASSTWPSRPSPSAARWP